VSEVASKVIAELMAWISGGSCVESVDSGDDGYGESAGDHGDGGCEDILITKKFSQAEFFEARPIIRVIQLLKPKDCVHYNSIRILSTLPIKRVKAAINIHLF
jgi:hypothetical protein